MAPWKPNSRSLGDQDDGEPRTLKESRKTDVSVELAIRRLLEILA